MDTRYRLVLLSALMLFVELTLMRWVGSNIFYLFFFSNFILLASFMGIGIGFLKYNSFPHLFRLTPIILAFIVFLSYLSGYEYQAVLDVTTDNLNYYGPLFKNNLYPVWLTLPIVFISVVFLMAGIASAVAKGFRAFTPLNAYRLEILGSLLGICIFSAASYMQQGPIFWGSVIMALYSPLILDEWRNKKYFALLSHMVMFCLIMGTFIVETKTYQHYWSSYYKIEVQEYSGHRYVVNVNGLAQQIIESVEQRLTVKPFYFVPYEQITNKPAFDNILVIGAGTGGDVAIALSQGAKHVDAVEIDPMLYQLGKKFNPNHPYDDPRVNIIIDDGRAFLRRTHNKYDMIIFALTDSLALIPGSSSIRLENFLYTIEGMRAASQHLKENGVFTLYNYYSLPWLRDRLANTLTQVYGHPPCTTQYSPNDYWAMVYTISKNANALNCTPLWKPNGNSYEKPITDNHPFMYLQESKMPSMYTYGLSFMLMACLVLLRWVGVSYSSLRANVPLFLMGVAFLLLETKNIINFALFFGTTWLVNSLVFVGILLTVYLSVEIRRAIAIPKTLLFMGLAMSLVVAWIIPNDFILSLPALLRFIVAVGVSFTPILFANMLFADVFNEADVSTDAFGANILGAVVGGVLEYASLVIGYRELLLIVIGLYALVFLLMISQKMRLAVALT